MENLSPSRETPKHVDSDLNDWFCLKQIVPNNLPHIYCTVCTSQLLTYHFIDKVNLL